MEQLLEVPEVEAEPAVGASPVAGPAVAVVVPAAYLDSQGASFRAASGNPADTQASAFRASSQAWAFRVASFPASSFRGALEIPADIQASVGLAGNRVAVAGAVEELSQQVSALASGPVLVEPSWEVLTLVGARQPIAQRLYDYSGDPPGYLHLDFSLPRCDPSSLPSVL